MFTKEYSDTQAKEKLEVLAYQPGLQDSGDLEAGAKAITAVTEASGLGNATYTASLTLPKPSDARLIVKRICARLQVTVDTIPSGDTNLYCRVYVDEQNAAHRLFDADWTSTGAKLLALDTHAGALATIFDLLKDGASHTFYFFFWKAGTGSGITISLLQLWEGVGSKIVGAGTPCLGISHTGLLSGFMACSKVGSGSTALRLCQGTQDTTYLWYIISTASESPVPLTMGVNFGIAINTTVDTDLAYLLRIILVLRSES
ncbi:MAG: hypothetical protein Q7T57_02650 [Dehalococcoidales bacterium]|nr:hypothetical protein [Dehalococcoidales bacterium]